MPSALASYVKDPADVVTLAFDFAAVLPDGATITAVASVTGDGVDVDGYAIASASRIDATLSGGVAPQDAAVTFTFATSSPAAQTLQRSAIIRIRER